MNKSRRDFLQTSLALGLAPMVETSPWSSLLDIEESDEKLKILILGGTGFLGPHQIAYALKRGHEVTTFTRGKTVPKIHTELFAQVEQLVGDRENDLEAQKPKMGCGD